MVHFGYDNDILRFAMSLSAFDLEGCPPDHIGRTVQAGLPDSEVASHLGRESWTCVRSTSTWPILSLCQG
jgi:hypothetical protein